MMVFTFLWDFYLYRKIIKEEGLSIRVVEVAGPQLKRKLQKSDPFKGKTCGRLDCFICSTGGRGPCDAPGVSYDIICLDCDDDNRYDDKYIGETSYSGYTRGGEHLNDLRLKKTKCRMYRHMMEKHNGLRPNFQMNVTGVYGKDTMLRQISEAIRIRHANPEKLMNNKSEWNTQIVPQVVIERT